MTPTEWLLGDDTGVSSKTICAVMTGSKNTGHFGPDIPWDAGDFGRCYRLLQYIPEWQDRLNEMAETYPKWGPMVEAWPELTEIYEEMCDEHGRVLRERNEKQEAAISKFWDRIREITDDCRRADGWVQTSPNSWEKKGPRGGFSVGIHKASNA